MGADGRVLTEVGFVLHALPGVGTRPLPCLQLGVPVIKLLPTGGRDSVEVAGCRFPVDFDDWLVVIPDHQKKVGHLRRLPPRLLTEPEGLHLFFLLV